MGKPLYTMTSPSGNVLVKVANCIMVRLASRSVSTLSQAALRMVEPTEQVTNHLKMY